MSSLFTVSWALTLFLFCFGVLWLWLAKETPPAERKKNIVDRVINAKVAFLGLGFAYLFLAHYTGYAGVITGLEIGQLPTCEYLVNTTVVTGNTTAYTYLNPCSGVAVANAVRGQLEGLNALLILDVFALFVGATFLIFRGFSKL